MDNRKMKNIYKGIPADLPEELIETIGGNTNVTIERIVSRGHCSGSDNWYDQPGDEFVLLLKGRAGLEFQDGRPEVVLTPGDHRVIAAHVKHRVAWTEPGTDTVWLAVHYPGMGETS